VNTRRLTTEKFVLKANNVHNFKYTYPDEYVGSREFINVNCLIHNTFSIRAYSHLEGTGCKKCDIERRASNNRYTHETFLNKAIKIHNNKYSYPAVYEHSNKLLTIICPIHGEFQQLPYTHLLGNGCKKCANDDSVGRYSETWFNDKPSRKIIPGQIYVLESEFQGGFYKIGISTNFQYRFARFPKQLNMKMLSVNDTMIYTAFRIEQFIIEKYNTYRYWPNIKFTGRTECFQRKFNIIDVIRQQLELTTQEN
jgi:hypothetical protein